jgi:hypothetical protein
LNTENKISIRKSEFARTGLIQLIDYVDARSEKKFKDFEMIEIGSYVGDSTQIFAARCSLINCVDPWRNGYDPTDESSHAWPMSIVEHQFDQLRKKFTGIIKYKMDSASAVLDFKDRSLDFIYIDGNHLYDFVKKDIEIWLPKLKKPGFIAGHDYGNKSTPGVKFAVNEILGEPDAMFSDKSWVKKIEQ